VPPVRWLLGDGDMDVQSVVDDFADDGGVLNGGGVAVLGTRVVRGSSSFESRSGDGRGTDDCSRS
jgi:hypothetical protein